jgi:hypothetical protein
MFDLKVSAETPGQMPQATHETSLGQERYNNSKSKSEYQYQVVV